MLFLKSIKCIKKSTTKVTESKNYFMIFEHNAIKVGIKSNDVIKILATKLIATVTKY